MMFLCLDQIIISIAAPFEKGQKSILYYIIIMWSLSPVFDVCLHNITSLLMISGDMRLLQRSYTFDVDKFWEYVFIAWLMEKRREMKNNLAMIILSVSCLPFIWMRKLSSTVIVCLSLLKLFYVQEKSIRYK